MTLDFHRPNSLICASDIPLAAAQEAAPIRKLCDLYRVWSSSQNCNASSSERTKYSLFTGLLSDQQKKDLESSLEVLNILADAIRGKLVVPGRRVGLLGEKGRYACSE